MTKRGKPKEPSTPVPDAAAARVDNRAQGDASPAGGSHGAVGPPGRVRSGGHGPQSGPVSTTVGAAKLRALLELSPTCDVDQVCDDAAREIEHLRNREDDGAILLPAHERFDQA